jgi:hypothetical protein
MNKKRRISTIKFPLLSFIGLTAALLLLYRNWFLSGALVGGDLGYLFTEQFSSYPFIPPAWQTLYNLGNANTALIWTGLLQNLYINTFGKFFDYNALLLACFLIPFLMLGSISSYLLIRELITKNSFFISIGILVYMTNTYILMAAGGGQIQIALAYAIAPLVLLRFIKIIDFFNKEKPVFQNIKLIRLSQISGLVLAVQMMFDPRIVYITLLAVMIYFILHMRFEISRNNAIDVLIRLLYTVFIPIGILVLLHAIWILPTLVYRQNPIQEMGSAFSSLDAVKFFSFAQFENAISLLHPNWPENIFGKVGFMRPEFLAIPIFAYSSLLFVRKVQRPRMVLYFAFLGLVGAFLAKGANDPFGIVYLWLFDHIPGFLMFRDPSKFYLLIALSYSALIAFSLGQIWEKLTKIKFKLITISHINSILIVSFLLIWLFTIRNAALGEIDGTFKIREVPASYIALKDYLNEKPEFFRTLWIPKLQRFGFYSENHPAVMAADLLNKYSLHDLLTELAKPRTEKVLQQSGVKYVIVPLDSEGELFIEDRKYSKRQDTYTRDQMKKISWLQYEKNIDGNDIFRVNNSKDRFWFAEDNAPVSWRMINPTHYQVELKEIKNNRKLVFSEAFNPQWKMKNRSMSISSEKFNERFNSFQVSQQQGVIDIYFEPQRLVTIASMISGISLISLVILLIVLSKSAVRKG